MCGKCISNNIQSRIELDKELKPEFPKNMTLMSARGVRANRRDPLTHPKVQGPPCEWLSKEII